MMLIQTLVQSKRIPAREASRGASPQARSNLRLALRSFAKCRGGSVRSPRAALWRPGRGAGCACRMLWPGHARGADRVCVEQRLYLARHLIVISVALQLRFGTSRTWMKQRSTTQE